MWNHDAKSCTATTPNSFAAVSVPGVQPDAIWAHGTSIVGMAIFLGSWAMMFAALFFSFAYLRLSATSWPPQGVPHLPLGLPAINTVVLIASSVVFHRGLASYKPRLPWRACLWIGVSAIMGATFLALQGSVWWSQWHGGLHMQGLYGGVFYALTTFHAAHVVAGLILLGWLIFTLHPLGNHRVGVTSTQASSARTRIQMIGLFWHFIDLAWVMTFLLVYLS